MLPSSDQKWFVTWSACDVQIETLGLETLGHLTVAQEYAGVYNEVPNCCGTELVLGLSCSGAKSLQLSLQQFATTCLCHDVACGSCISFHALLPN